MLVRGMLIMLFIIFMASPSVFSHNFQSLGIEAFVLEDGSLHVTETWQVQLVGAASGMYRWIYRPRDIPLVEILVQEEGQPYPYNPGSEPGPAGTYYTESYPDRVYIDWSFSARDETRVFQLSYRLLNLILIHQDGGELYYDFVGDEWDYSIDEVQVDLYLPRGAEEGEVMAWGHGPLYGEVRIVSPRHVRWQVSPLPAGTGLTGRMVFPEDLVAEGRRTFEDRVEAIILQEKERAKRADEQVWLARVDLILAPIVFLLSLLVFIYLWTRYNREHAVPFQGAYYRKLPGEYSPAELGVLWRFNMVNTQDVLATIMDLARRGYIMIEEYKIDEGSRQEKKGYILKRLEEDDPPLVHEKKLVDFLFREVGQGPEVSFQDLEEFTKKNKKEFSRFWKEWQKELKKRGQELNFFDENSVNKGRKLQVGSGVLLFLGAATVLIKGMIFTALAFFLGGLILILAGAVARRRSEKGARDFVRWRAFQRFLRDFSRLDRQGIPGLTIWEHYLVYAVSLGVAHRVLRQLNLVFPDLEMPWPWFAVSRGSAANFTSLEGFAGGFQKAIQTGVSSMASTGGGGGFSAGGGAGVGGGGGGIR